MRNFKLEKSGLAKDIKRLVSPIAECFEVRMEKDNSEWITALYLVPINQMFPTSTLKR